MVGRLAVETGKYVLLRMTHEPPDMNNAGDKPEHYRFTLFGKYKNKEALMKGVHKFLNKYDLNELSIHREIDYTLDFNLEEIVDDKK